MRNPLPLLIIDLDDTLVDTSHVYWLSRSKFVDALTAHGIDPIEAVELFEEQDALNLQDMGFSPERYSKTMADVYDRLVTVGRLAPRKDLAADLLAHGRIVIDQLPELIAGAREVLDWAQKRFQLVLLTRGFELLQMQKIAHAAIAEFFDEINVVGTKGPEQFADLMRKHKSEPSQTWVLGDSIRSDINPAMHAGANAILYAYSHHSYYWRQEYGVVPEGYFYKIDYLPETISILENPAAHARVSPQQWIDAMSLSPHPGAR